MQSHVTTEHEMIMECDQENVNVLLVVEMGGVTLRDQGRPTSIRAVHARSENEPDRAIFSCRSP